MLDSCEMVEDFKKQSTQLLKGAVERGHGMGREGQRSDGVRGEAWRAQKPEPPMGSGRLEQGTRAKPGDPALPLTD